MAVPAGNNAESAKARVLGLFSELGVPVSLSKLIGPVACLEYLGHEIDTATMTCHVAPAKLEAALALIKETQSRTHISRRDLQSLIGKLFFLTRVVRQGRAFLGRALALLRGKPRAAFKVSMALRADLAWWGQFLPTWEGTSIHYDDYWLSAKTLELYTDASEIGAGAIFGQQWFSYPWTQQEVGLAQRAKRLSMPFLELLAIGHALATWGDQLHGMQVVLFSDNMGAVWALNKLFARDERLLALVRTIVTLTIQMRFVLRLRHVKSLDNVLADPLSRLDIPLFQERCPWANEQPSTVTQISLTG